MTALCVALRGKNIENSLTVYVSHESFIGRHTIQPMLKYRNLFSCNTLLMTYEGCEDAGCGRGNIRDPVAAVPVVRRVQLIRQTAL